MHDSDEKESVLSFGQTVRRQRELAGMSVEDAARKMTTSVRYVRALEEEDYAVFGARVYARGCVKKILSVMEDASPALADAFDRSWESWQEREGTDGSRSPLRAKNLYVTPARIGLGACAVALAVFVFFVGARTIDFSSAPALVLEEPRDQALLSEPIVTLAGMTEKESTLTVNGREVTIDEHGNFHEPIELQEGINRLELVAQNRFGKQTTLIRHVLVQ